MCIFFLIEKILTVKRNGAAVCSAISKLRFSQNRHVNRLRTDYDAVNFVSFIYNKRTESRLFRNGVRSIGSYIPRGFDGFDETTWACYIYSDFNSIRIE